MMVLGINLIHGYGVFIFNYLIRITLCSLWSNKLEQKLIDDEDDDIPEDDNITLILDS